MDEVSMDREPLRLLDIQLEGGRVPNRLRWLIVALLTRLLMLPYFMHTDNRFVGDIVALSYRGYMYVADPNSLERYASLVYPFLGYHTIFVYLSTFQRFIPSFPIAPPYAASALLQWIESPTIFRLLFVAKGLSALFDLGTGLLLLWFFRGESRTRALLFWVFNPLILYNVYFHGQIDVIPVFFLMLALLCLKRFRPCLGSFWIGIGACYKIFPLFFLLPAILVFTKSAAQRMRLLFIGVIPFLLLMLPNARKYATGISTSSELFFKGEYALGFGARIYVFFVFYAALLWYLHCRKAHTFEDFWRACLAILLVYYQFSYFDLHYWAWIVPFALIYWVERPQEAKPFYLVIGLCLLVLLAPTPLGRFLAPISPRFFLRLPSLMETLNPYLPMLFIVNVVRSLMAGTCFYLAWRLLRGMPASRNQMPQSIPEPKAAV
ncbi:MAG: glycosyltransferase family 87 protein [Candidatus Methanosuratincola sp.]